MINSFLSLLADDLMMESCIVLGQTCGVAGLPAEARQKKKNVSVTERPAVRRKDLN